MAEIEVQKKKTNIWPWIIGLLVLAAILYFVFGNNNNADKAMTDRDTTTAVNTTQQNEDAVAAYVTYVRQDTSQMGLDHSYSSNALNKLADAIQYKASATGYDVKTDLDKVRDYASQITNDPYETSHADKIRAAADIISTTLQNMQQAKYPSLSADAGEVKNAAGAINPSVLTLDQKGAVQSFFSKAADMLQKMQ